MFIILHSSSFFILLHPCSSFSSFFIFPHPSSSFFILLHPSSSFFILHHSSSLIDIHIFSPILFLICSALLFFRATPSSSFKHACHAYHSNCGKHYADHAEGTSTANLEVGPSAPVSATLHVWCVFEHTTFVNSLQVRAPLPGFAPTICTPLLVPRVFKQTPTPRQQRFRNHEQADSQTSKERLRAANSLVAAPYPKQFLRIRTSCCS